jgi:hypothetical protein
MKVNCQGCTARIVTEWCVAIQLIWLVLLTLLAFLAVDWFVLDGGMGLGPENLASCRRQEEPGQWICAQIPESKAPMSCVVSISLFCAEMAVAVLAVGYGLFCSLTEPQGSATEEDCQGLMVTFWICNVLLAVAFAVWLQPCVLQGLDVPVDMLQPTALFWLFMLSLAFNLLCCTGYLIVFAARRCCCIQRATPQQLSLKLHNEYYGSLSEVEFSVR